VSEAPRLAAFTACGIELEYMIVDRRTLDVRAVADALLRAPDGSWSNDLERGAFGWSNELAAHLVEVKNNDPTTPLEALVAGFGGEIREIHRALEPLGARLMPGSIHPWMDPRREARLWSHDYREVYEAYDRIFDCRRHGWANLQSMHVNLPFGSDLEFARLHAAVRLVLPILPALAASSPIADGEFTGFLDYRMECYRTHTERLPSLMGPVIPEPVTSERQYRSEILAPMYREIAPFDLAGDMQDEWLNSRAAIARFDRSAIEIRVIDTQERPVADLAVAAATVAVTRRCYERAAEEELSAPVDSARLLSLLRACARDAERTVIDDGDYLRRMGFPGARCAAGELWRHLLEATLFALPDGGGAWREPLELILSHGTLARRILEAAGAQPTRARLLATGGRLCGCLAAGEPFVGSD
jgi:carboxylate-amine ligase